MFSSYMYIFKLLLVDVSGYMMCVNVPQYMCESQRTTLCILFLCPLFLPSTVSLEDQTQIFRFLTQMSLSSEPSLWLLLSCF